MLLFYSIPFESSLEASSLYEMFVNILSLRASTKWMKCFSDRPFLQKAFFLCKKHFSWTAAFACVGKIALNEEGEIGLKQKIKRKVLPMFAIVLRDPFIVDCLPTYFYIP